MPNYQRQTVVAPKVARLLVERSLEGADRRDDSLALVIRHRSPVVVEPHLVFSHRGGTNAGEVPRIRHEFRSWLSNGVVENSVAEDLCVVVSELVTNAIRVGESFFELRAWSSDDGVVVEVEDDGPG